MKNNEKTIVKTPIKGVRYCDKTTH